MLSKHASNVSLAEHLASFVRKEINKGRYGTVSEVVGVGLCLLNEDVARRAVSGSGNGAVRTTHIERTHGRSEASTKEKQWRQPPTSPLSAWEPLLAQ